MILAVRTGLKKATQIKIGTWKLIDNIQIGLVERVILIPENYPWTIVKISYDRLNPRSYEVLWPLADQVETTEDASSASSPLLVSTQQPPRAQDSKTEAEKIERVYQLAEGNDELIRLLNQLLPRSPE